MVKKEFHSTRKDGVNLFASKSDCGMKILKKGTDELYDVAIDVEGAPFAYEETKEPIGIADGEES